MTAAARARCVTLHGPRAINTMTAREAENAKIAERERGYYFRADIGKANLTSPAERADWFRLTSVDLENGTDELDVGDSVGVVATWKYPVVAPPKVTMGTVRAAQEAIGGQWRADQRSTNEPWVGIPVAKALGIDLCGKVNCRTVARTVDDWLRAGWLKRVPKKDGFRNARMYVEVGETAVVDEPPRSKKGEKQQEVFVFPDVAVVK